MTVVESRPSSAAGVATRTSYHTCPLCEATCGLEIRTENGAVTSIRGDRDDVLSAGFICPKAVGLSALETDPDRVRTPLLRDGASFRAVTWDEAYAEIDRRLAPLLQTYGRNAAAVYLGNPVVHSLSGMLYAPVLLRALGTRSVFTASTVDQMPKQVACGLMFGAGLSVPVPDVDRTDLLVILGANPLESNGSLLTAPDMRGRIRRLRARGGRLIVVDPRRTRTAEEADVHHFIRPGTDAHLLAAVVQVLFAENLIRPERLSPHLAGIEEVRALVQPFTPDVVAPRCGIAAEAIRTLARDLAAASRAAVYARIGSCTQEFGTLASWLVDVVNALTGNLDREGGAMFPRAAAGARNTAGEGGRGRGVQLGRWRTRVRGLPEVFGELPVSCLAEEIDTPGDGRIRALFTVAGNPALSTPNSGRLRRALPQLDLMVSVDLYVNETTRHAHLILPAPSPLARSHLDLVFAQLAIRNTVKYSAPVLPLPEGQPDEWEILLRLAGIAMGQGPSADVEMLDELVARTLLQRDVSLTGSPVHGRDVDELLVELAPLRGPERLLDLLLRVGPYGEGFGQRPEGLTLSRVRACDHGVDLGPLQPRLPEVLRTPSGRVELAPAPIAADVARLRDSLQRHRDTLVLVGRRDLRSNNSWMHNVEMLVRGPDRCTLHIHPDDAAARGLHDGDRALVRSRAGEVAAPVHVTDAVMRGVVSLPHGWGHDDPATSMRVAAAHAGVNCNALVDESQVDPLSGNAVLSGVPVEVLAREDPQ